MIITLCPVTFPGTRVQIPTISIRLQGVSSRAINLQLNSIFTTHPIVFPIFPLPHAWHLENYQLTHNQSYNRLTAMQSLINLQNNHPGQRLKNPNSSASTLHPATILAPKYLELSAVCVPCAALQRGPTIHCSTHL